ncbi:arginine utilization transcriptional regulator RocR, partial [Bacillus anthracis]|nr:arginine utilization transcriptional regulator RocR [Bacillus anthracis]
RERTEDVLLLASYFLKEYNKSYKKGVLQMDKEAKERLQSYQWPGNVRELKHTIEHAVIIAEGNTLTANCLPRTFRKESFPKKKSILPLREALHQTEKELIDQALIETEGNILQAAKMLGIPRQTLQYKLSKYDKTAE